MAKDKLKVIGVWALILVTAVAVGYAVFMSNTETTYERFEVEVDTSVEKIEQIKQQLVTDLALNCEVKGIKEGARNGTTVLDSNRAYSRGQWQFQSLTVIHYYDVLYNQTINFDEAVLISHTEEKARSLAYDIIWEEVGGIYNWKNCAERLGLVQKIEIVRELEK